MKNFWRTLTRRPVEPVMCNDDISASSASCAGHLPENAPRRQGRARDEVQGAGDDKRHTGDCRSVHLPSLTTRRGRPERNRGQDDTMELRRSMVYIPDE